MSQDSGGFGGYNPPQSGGSGFRPLGQEGRPSNFGVQPLGSTPLGGDIHETFGVNEQGDLFGGHTTIRLPGLKEIHLPWGDK